MFSRSFPHSKGTGSLSTAASWTLATKLGDQLVGIVSISMLARILSPSDFGLVAMAGAVVALVQVFTNFGFDWALVRLQSPDRQHYDTAWTLRLLVSVSAASVLCLAAVPASLWLASPPLLWLVLAMAINGVLASLENIGVVDFRRDMRFDLEFRLRILSRLTGFVAAVATAYITRSYWALVAGITASHVAAVIASYTMHGFRPSLSLKHRAELLSFSLWMMIGSVLEVLRQRISDLWIGRHFGTSAVGLYSMAQQLALLASSEIAAPINRAVFTSYAAKSGSQRELRDSFLQVASLIWSIGVPAAVGIWVCAPEIVLVLLGGQWSDAIAVLQILALSGLLSVMSSNTQYVYWAIGRSRFVTFLSALSLIVFAACAVPLGLSHGLAGVASAQVIASLVRLIVNYTVLTSTIDMSISVFLRRTARLSIAACIMGVATGGFAAVVLRPNLNSPLLILLLSVALGAGTYVLLVWSFWRLASSPPGPEKYMFDLVHEKIRKPRLDKS